MELLESTKNVQKEITPISVEDLFIVLDRPNAKFDYPIHYHSEYELNLVIGSKGKRIVGDSISDFGQLDIVLIGPNLPHVWKGDSEEGNHVVTIQFQEQLLTFPILTKRLFNPIKDLLQRSSRGIEFTGETKLMLKDKILEMTKNQGFDIALNFLSVLNSLAITEDQRILADPHFSPNELAQETSSRRITKVCNYVEKNFKEQIKLRDISQIIGMSDSAFSHFFKKKTKRNFIDYINDIRIGYASQMLFETTNSISEVCYKCGFNNISNFIRMFKKRKGETPSEYRLHVKKTLTKF